MLSLSDPAEAFIRRQQGSQPKAYSESLIMHILLSVSTCVCTLIGMSLYLCVSFSTGFILSWQLILWSWWKEGISWSMGNQSRSWSRRTACLPPLSKQTCKGCVTKSTGWTVLNTCYLRTNIRYYIFQQYFIKISISFYSVTEILNVFHKQLLYIQSIQKTFSTDLICCILYCILNLC